MSKAAPIGKPVETKNLELSLLRTFLALVQHGSMGKTAAAARVTQPAVSAQVLRLENIVGRRLFVRNRNGAKLTSHGELLITYANRAVALNEEALARLRGETMRKRVTLGMSTEVALIGFATAMKQFRSLHQDLELRVVVAARDFSVFLPRAAKVRFPAG
jgi:DNA-binding transcriptional LysR family regulator